MRNELGKDFILGCFPFCLDDGLDVFVVVFCRNLWMDFASLGPQLIGWIATSSSLADCWAVG